MKTAEKKMSKKALAKPGVPPPAPSLEFLCPYFATEIAPVLGMKPEDFGAGSGQDPCSFCRCNH